MSRTLFPPDGDHLPSPGANLSSGDDRLANALLLFDGLDEIPTHLQRLLEEADPHIEYVDLTPALKAASRAGIPTYLADDTHWTAEGNRVAADTIHRALQKASQTRISPDT